MILKNRYVQLVIAALLAMVVMALPRPEGSTFEIKGDAGKRLLAAVAADFSEAKVDRPVEGAYQVKAIQPGSQGATAKRLAAEAQRLGLKVTIDYLDGLSPTAHRFLAAMAFIIFLFVFEPVPLPITACGIGVILVATGVSDLKSTWAAYMHPVVVFIMCCLILAIALEKAGLTHRLSAAIARKAGSSVTRFTLMLSVGLGLASSVMHDAAATAIGLATMLPLMRAVGIKPHTNTARFMMLSVAFACSCGGMGTLVGGGRCMVSAAFLKEFTGIELSFMDWLIYAGPLALVTVPVAVIMLYFVYRPDSSFKLPKVDDKPAPWSPMEIKACVILSLIFVAWLTKSLHGLDYSLTGMVGVALMVLTGVLTWDDIHTNLEWGTALFIFGGGIALGLAMDASGAARYFAYLFFPLVKGGGWLLLLAGVAVFGSLVTNAMANVAAAAMILPITLPLAQLEGVDPRVVALGLGTATSFAMLLVIGCPPNAIAYSYKQFKAFDLTKAGLVVMPVLLIVLLSAAGLWWSLLGLI